MKKWVLTFIFITTLITSTFLLALTLRPSITAPEIQIKIDQKKTETPKRSIELQYSQLKPDSKSAMHLNALILGILQKKEKQFMEISKESILPSVSSLIIKDSVLFYAPKKIISIQYQQFSYYSGQAHPTTTYYSINYDLNFSKSLQLKDLLINPRRDLQYIAIYATKNLSKKDLGRVNFVIEGARPKKKNYQNWNLTNKGLLITFNAGQVAATVYGAQEVLIPYSLLKGRIKQYYAQALSS